MTHHTEETLVLIKPDGVARNLVGEILARIERKGYVIADLKMLTPTRAMLERHYEEHQGLSLIHISEPTRHFKRSRMPSSA